MNNGNKKKIPCEIWSRIVGYFRGTDTWNKGKKQEFEERKQINWKKIKFKKEKLND